MKVTTEPKDFVRVLNPASEETAVVKLYKEFSGRRGRSFEICEAPKGTPEILARLGELRELNVEPTEDFWCVFPRKEFSTVRVRNITLSYKRGEALLCADGQHRLHIVNACKLDLARGIEAGETYRLGRINSVVYRVMKTHLEGRPENYKHEFGDAGGWRPSLIFRDGYLFISGGTYQVTRAGIVN